MTSEINSLNLEPSNFDFTTDEGRTKYFMTAQIELFNAISTLEQAMPELTSIMHTIDLELSSNKRLRDIDNILNQYLLSWSALQLYYRQLLKIKNIFPDE